MNTNALLPSTRYNILDSGAEEVYDRIVRLAARHPAVSRPTFQNLIQRHLCLRRGGRDQECAENCERCEQ